MPARRPSTRRARDIPVHVDAAAVGSVAPFQHLRIVVREGFDLAALLLGALRDAVEHLEQSPPHRRAPASVSHT